MPPALRLKLSSPMMTVPSEPSVALPRASVPPLLTVIVSVPPPKLLVSFENPAMINVPPPLTVTLSLPPPETMRPFAVPPVTFMTMGEFPEEETRLSASTRPPVTLILMLPDAEIAPKAVVFAPPRMTPEPELVIVPPVLPLVCTTIPLLPLPVPPAPKKMLP